MDSIWLIAPLIGKLAPAVQGRVLKAAGHKLETGNNFWTAKNAKEKEKYLQKRWGIYMIQSQSKILTSF